MKGEGWVTRAVFSSDGKLLLVAGGANKPFNTQRWTEFPDERERLFRIVSGE